MFIVDGEHRVIEWYQQPVIDEPHPYAKLVKKYTPNLHKLYEVSLDPTIPPSEDSWPPLLINLKV